MNERIALNMCYVISEFFGCLLQVHCFDVDKLNRMYEGRYKHVFMATYLCSSLWVELFLKIETRNKIGEPRVYSPKLSFICSLYFLNRDYMK